MRFALVASLASATLFAAACSEDPEVDELAGESVADGEDGKADGGEFTYFDATPDLRRCAWPWCGGRWVDRVNRARTTCADGSQAERCYVVDINWANSGLSQDQVDEVEGQIGGAGYSESGSRVLLRGKIVKKDFGPELGQLGSFEVDEAWVAQTDGFADGVFVKVKDLGIRCITSPCPGRGEYKLNSTLTATIGELDFDPSGATDEQIQAAIGETYVNGLIVAGDRYTKRENGQRYKNRTVTQAYHRVIPAPPSECVVTGCSAQICADEEMFTTCEWQEHYACYADATCARQADGRCGWTETPELNACIEGSF